MCDELREVCRCRTHVGRLVPPSLPGQHEAFGKLSYRGSQRPAGCHRNYCELSTAGVNIYSWHREHEFCMFNKTLLLVPLILSCQNSVLQAKVKKPIIVWQAPSSDQQSSTYPATPSFRTLPDCVWLSLRDSGAMCWHWEELRRGTTLVTSTHTHTRSSPSLEHH